MSLNGNEEGENKFPPVCFKLPVVVAISFRKVAREWRVGESFCGSGAIVWTKEAMVSSSTGQRICEQGGKSERLPARKGSFDTLR